MKKLLTTFATIACMILAASCSNDEPSNVSPLLIKSSDDIVSFSSKRTIDEAATIACDAIGMLPQGDSRSGARTFSKENVKYGISNSYSRSVGDTIMYVFNFDDNQGFAVVAADKNKQGLIAVTESGSYDPDVTPDNLGLALYMDAAKQYLANPNSTNSSINPYFTLLDSLKDTRNDKELAQYKIMDKTITLAYVEPVTTAKWGQSYPEGVFYRNGIAGCTNTALLIALRQLHKPDSIILTHDNNKKLYLEWDLISNHTISHDQLDESDNDGCWEKNTYIHYEISHLCREIGVRNNCDDTTSTSQTNTHYGNIPQCVLGMGLKANYFVDYNEALVKSTLENSGVIIMCGMSYNRDSPKGHVWVVSGLKYYSYWMGEYIKLPGQDWKLINDCGTTHYHLHYYNWGWEGNANGYYLSDVFNPKNNSELNPLDQIKYDYDFKEIQILPIFAN